MKRHFSKLVAIVLLFALMATLVVGCSSGEQAASTRTITDMAGRQVEIPTHLSRVVSVFPYVTYTMLALGGDNILVAVDTASSQNANLAKVYPAIKEKPAVGSAFNINKESVLQANPEVVLTVTWDRDPDKTQSTLGVPVLCVDMNLYKESIDFIANVIGKENKAKEFTRYYDEKIAYIASHISDVAPGNKTKVYIGGGNGVLSVFGKESTWHYEIVDAGGINVGADLIGGGSLDVSMEQVLIWNPDVVILDKTCPDSVSKVLSDPTWLTVNAVTNGLIIV